MHTRRTSRAGFSLLEMVLSLALAMVLLLGLYLTLNTYILNADLGRETLQEGEVARSILTRIAHDAGGQLGTTDTRGLPTYFAGVLSENRATPFNVGVKGDANSLILSSARVVSQPAGKDPANPDTEIKSDLRRIHYWVVMNGNEITGLARREFKLATSPDIDPAPGDTGDQEKYLITKNKEIKSVTFEFHDGTTWVPSWNGDELLGEALAQRGAPAAIKITLVLRPPASAGAAAVETTTDLDQKLTFVHVIALCGDNVQRSP